MYLNENAAYFQITGENTGSLGVHLVFRCQTSLNDHLVRAPVPNRVYCHSCDDAWPGKIFVVDATRDFERFGRRLAALVYYCLVTDGWCRVFVFFGEVFHSADVAKGDYRNVDTSAEHDHCLEGVRVDDRSEPATYGENGRDE